MYFSNLRIAIILLTTQIPLCHSRTVSRFCDLKRNKVTRDTKPIMDNQDFAEFRRKVQHAELLSASMEKLLRGLHFSGRLSVIVKNGSILKSGYEEGYFTRREDERMIS
jgi:hypothetical protein